MERNQLRVMMQQFLRDLISIFFCLILITGCSASRYFYKNNQFLEGTYHTVRQGETLWSISRSYGLSIEEIAKWNHFKSLDNIEKHQQIFIPAHLKKKKNFSKETKLTVSNPKGLFACPVNIPFSRYQEFLRDKGLSINVHKEGSVFASASGTVSFSDKVFGLGHVILIEHNNEYVTVYGHLKKSFIDQGDHVFQGQKLGHLKKSPNRYFSLLRFEIRKNGQKISPLLFFV